MLKACRSDVAVLLTIARVLLQYSRRQLNTAIVPQRGSVGW